MLHRIDSAIREFTACVKACDDAPVSEQAKALYWLAISLYRAGQRSLAVKSLRQARCLCSSLSVRRTHERLVNEYGMPRCKTRDLDDWQAFRSIQLARFLSSRRSGCFYSNAERDATIDQLFDAWKPLLASGRLSRMSTEAKLALFRAAKPVLHQLSQDMGHFDPSKATFPLAVSKKPVSPSFPLMALRNYAPGSG